MLTFKRVSSLFIAVSVAACAAQDAPIDHEAELAQLEAANESFTGSISAMDLEGIFCRSYLVVHVFVFLFSV